MTANEQRLIFAEMNRLMEEQRKRIMLEISDAVKAFSREVHKALTGVGILDSEERLLTKAQVCQRYGVSKTKLESMMANGEIAFIKNGNNPQSTVRFRPVDAREAFESYVR